MFGLNWLYRKARQFKKLAFFVSGAGVAISTATAKTTPVVSWIANLIAVTAAGFYSIFKNTETAAAITGRQQEIDTTKTALTLDHYRDQPISLPEVLTQATVFTDEEKGKIQISVLRDFTVESSSYVNWNLVLQGVLGVIAVVINTLANVESDSKSDTTVYYLNLTIVPICILSQYLAHMVYVADGLRTITTDATALQTKLSTVRHGLLFRALERKDYSSFRERLAKELEDISQTLDTQKNQKQQKQDKLTRLYREIELITQRVNEASVKFGIFNIEQYIETIVDHDLLVMQLTQALSESKREDITIEFCFDYIRDKQGQLQVRKNITLTNGEIRDLAQQIEILEKKKEGLKCSHDLLLQKEPEFSLIEVSLQKLSQINSP